jgi:phosphate transport system substrate-binding protein
MTKQLKRLKRPFVLGVPVLALAFLMPACRRSEHLERIQVKGSDTEVNLVLELAEAFMEREPAVSISITGGGSGVGIAALMNGKTDIAKLVA